MVLDWILYAILRLLVGILSLFSIRVNLCIARFFGRCFWKYFKQGRERVLQNLKAASPERDLAWYTQIGRRSFEHLAMLVVGIFFMPRLVTLETDKKYVKFHNVEEMKWRMKFGPGMIWVTAHYGNFELIGWLLSLMGFKINVIVRPLDNPFVDRWLTSIREFTGQKLINKNSAMKKLKIIMAQRTILGVAPDQDAGSKGLFVNFFGKKASAHKSVALLAIKYKLPVCVVYARRRENQFFFDVGVNRMILPEEWADKAEPLKWITQEYTKAIEQFIQNDITQYWWVHRRWKTRPRGEQ